MFTLGYFLNSDPETDRKIISLDSTYHNFETARSQGRNLAKHPSFNFKTVVIIDHSHPHVKVYKV